MLQVGEQIAGYRIDAIAGIGGMGVVYRATQLSLERPVALKVLSTTLVGNRTFRERFRREGRHAAALDHPHIIPVYEAGESNGLMFIAMRLVDGPTLADLMQREQLTARETLRILGAIASALDAAHESGLVHRDVKPPNILLTKAGHPYLADFGITKGSQTGSLTKTGDVVGSLSYVAPEQMEGEEVTPQSDVYSLTAVLFECLTGTRPYDRDTDAALMRAHLVEPPPTISGLGIDAPPELDAVFQRGMAKRPGERHLTAGALLDDIAGALQRLAPELLDRAPALAPDGPDLGSSSGLAPPAPPRKPPPPPRERRSRAPLADPTSADRRRPSREQTDSGAGGRRMPRPATIAAIVAAALATAVLGYLAGSGDDAPPAPQVERSASVALTVPAGWRTATNVMFRGLELEAPVGLRHSSGVVLVAGRLKDPASGLDPTRQALRAVFSSARASAVRVGGHDGLRLAGAQADGGSAWVVVMPDSAGWTAVACRSVATTGLEARCGPLAATLRPLRATPLRLAPDAALGETLRSELATLDEARSAAHDPLRATSAQQRADAATTLAEATSDTARLLSGTRARPHDRSLVRALVEALQGEAAALTRLAQAAKDGDRPAYRRRRNAVGRAERATANALRGLRRGGYDAAVKRA